MSKILINSNSEDKMFSKDNESWKMNVVVAVLTVALGLFLLVVAIGMNPEPSNSITVLRIQAHVQAQYAQVLKSIHREDTDEWSHMYYQSLIMAHELKVARTEFWLGQAEKARYDGLWAVYSLEKASLAISGGKVDGSECFVDWGSYLYHISVKDAAEAANQILESPWVFEHIVFTNMHKAVEARWPCGFK